jgi:polyvinyl alcohol dehydrogenase (cytochrome)
VLRRGPRILIGLLALALSSAQAAEVCTSTPGVERLLQSGWGIDVRAQRFQHATAIGADNAASLRLRWAYGFGTDQPRVFPLVSEDTIFIGDGGVGIVALDRETGCTRWVNDVVDDAATALSHGRVGGRTILVGTGRMSGVFAIDAETGETLWHRRVTDDNPVAMYSGSPLVFEDQVFVPISSLEIGLSVLPIYGCCVTSGGMAALDLATGETRWYRRTIPDEPAVTGRHWLFVEERGPSGAPVWQAPTLDVERRQLYFGTGQNYSHPTTFTSDSIFAVDIDTGDPVWIAQFTENDAFNMACGREGRGVNCPDPMGPDVDFGAPPVLVRRADGSDVVIAGQKSGDVWAMDPDTGATRWHTRVGRGGALGGIHWGMASDEDRGLLFVPISDVEALPGEGEAEPGLFALDVASGERVWSVPRIRLCEGWRCQSGLSAAITAAPGVVVTGGLDGRLEIIDSTEGEVIWSFDTQQDFEAVNGIPTRGGAIDAHGPVFADDLLIAVSGYRTFGQTPGNALLVFELTGDAEP